MLLCSCCVVIVVVVTIVIVVVFVFVTVHNILCCVNAYNVLIYLHKDIRLCLIVHQIALMAT